MNKVKKSEQTISRRSLLTWGLATRVVTVVALVILMSLFTSLQAQSPQIATKRVIFGGFINGDPVSYSGFAVTDVATGHQVADLWYVSESEAVKCTRWHCTKWTRN